jgi:hypothetical protein
LARLRAGQRLHEVFLNVDLTHKGICGMGKAVSNQDVSYLLDLIGLCHAISWLKIEDFGDSITPKDMMIHDVLIIDDDIIDESSM